MDKSFENEGNNLNYLVVFPEIIGLYHFFSSPQWNFWAKEDLL